MKLYPDHILDSCLIVLMLSFCWMYIKYVVVPASKRSKLNDPWEDFYHEEFHNRKDKRIILRVFRADAEYEALKDIPTHKMLEIGHVSAQYKFAIFEK